MATPRRHWFRCDDEVERLALDNDELALYVRLLAHLNTRRSRDVLTPEAACRVVLRPQVLAALAGCQSLARARRILARLVEHLGSTSDGRPVDEASATDGRGVDEASTTRRCDVDAPWTWRVLGVNTEIVARNLAESQGWASESRASRGSDRARESPSPVSVSDSVSVSGSDTVTGERSSDAPHRTQEAESPAAPSTRALHHVVSVLPEPEGEGEPEALADLREFAAARHPEVSREIVTGVYAATMDLAARKMIPRSKWPELLRRELYRVAARGQAALAERREGEVRR